MRNGSCGLLWLETLVEVQTADGRVAYGSVDVEDRSIRDGDWVGIERHAGNRGGTGTGAKR